MNNRLSGNSNKETPLSSHGQIKIQSALTLQPMTAKSKRSSDVVVNDNRSSGGNNQTHKDAESKINVISGMSSKKNLNKHHVTASGFTTKISGLGFQNKMQQSSSKTYKVGAKTNSQVDIPGSIVLNQTPFIIDKQKQIISLEPLASDHIALGVKTPTALGPASLATHFKSNVSASSHGSNSSRNLRSLGSSKQHQFNFKKGSMTNRDQDFANKTTSSQDNFMQAQQAVNVTKNTSVNRNAMDYRFQNNTFGSIERNKATQNQILSQARKTDGQKSFKQDQEGSKLKKTVTNPDLSAYKLKDGLMFNIQSPEPPRDSQLSTTSYNVRSSAGENTKKVIVNQTPHPDFMEIETSDSLLKEEDSLPNFGIETLLVRLIRLEVSQNQGLSEEWQRMLDSQNVSELIRRLFPYLITDADILTTELGVKHQRVIRADSERTKIRKIKRAWKNPESLRDESIDEIVKDSIEKLLTYYVRSTGILYKQGLNEILAPFLWLAMQYSPTKKHSQETVTYMTQNPLAVSYCCMRLFVKNFMPTIFIDEDFMCLQSCLCFLRLLLKYHDPQVCLVLSSAMVTPDLYATNWFLTMLATKSSTIGLVCELWSELIDHKDPRHFLFVSLAMIIQNREQILNCSRSDLPLLMANLGFTSSEEVSCLLQKSYTLKHQTPRSFLDLKEMNAILGPNAEETYKTLSAQEKMHIHQSLEQMQCLPVQIEEVLNNLYPTIIRCENQSCINHEREMLLRTPVHSKEEAIYSQKLQQEIQNGGLLDILISNHFFNQVQSISNQFSDQKNKGIKVNKLILSPSKIVKNPTQQFLNPKSIVKDNLSQLKIHTMNSGTKSPFKTMVKQQPIEADASVVPMETETNVKDDEDEDAAYQNQSSNSLYSVLCRRIQNEFESGSLQSSLCEECQRGDKSLLSRHSDPSKIRLIVIDCRMDLLRAEGMLPRTCKFDFQNELVKSNMHKCIKELLSGCKENDHICLLGLEEQDGAAVEQEPDLSLTQSVISSTGQEETTSMRVFHQKVLRTIIEIFYKEQTKYVSFLPGGFKECHDFIAKQNLVQLLNWAVDKEMAEPPYLQVLEAHDYTDCFYCAQSFEQQHLTDTNSQKQIEAFSDKYSFLFTMNSVSQVEESKQGYLDNNAFDILTGFKNWWQDNISNQKLLSGFTTGVEIQDEQLVQRERANNYGGLANITELTRSNMFKQQDPTKLMTQDALSLVDQQQIRKGNQPILHFKQNNSKSFAAMGITKQVHENNVGLMPIESTESGKQQQTLEAQKSFQHIRKQTQMPSRDRSSTTKCQAPGLTMPAQVLKAEQTFDIQDDSHHPAYSELGAQEVNQGLFSPGLMQNNHYYQLHNNKARLVKGFQPNVGSTDNSLVMRAGTEIKDSQQSFDVGDQISRTGSLSLPFNYKNPQEITTDGQDMSQSQQSDFNYTQKAQPQDKSDRREQLLKSQAPSSKQQPGSQISNVDTNSKKNQQNVSKDFLLEERSYYLCNGIQKQQSYANYIYKVQQIIDQDFVLNPVDIVVYHVKRLASSHLQQSVQQQFTNSKADNAQTPALFGSIPIEPSMTSIIITQFTTICLSQHLLAIQSRFFMHDLIKITSRKSSAKIITFYFRIPQFGEYNQSFFEELEQEKELKGYHEILDNFNCNPRIPYLFAYKRKKYQEVKMGFEFKTEEEAKDCIERVSILYKRLKENNNLNKQLSQTQPQTLN